MPSPTKQEEILTAAECLKKLPELPLEPTETDSETTFRRADLNSSLLAIADLDHVSETHTVRALAHHVLGRLPTLDE